MLSQESQKMCLECSMAIKCELLKNFKNSKFEIYTLKLLNKSTLNEKNWTTWQARARLFGRKI